MCLCKRGKRLNGSAASAQTPELIPPAISHLFPSSEGAPRAP